MKGLAVESTSRLQRLDELYDLLYESEEAEYWNGEATGVPEEHRQTAEGEQYIKSHDGDGAASAGDGGSTGEKET